MSSITTTSWRHKDKTIPFLYGHIGKWGDGYSNNIMTDNYHNEDSMGEKGKFHKFIVFYFLGKKAKVLLEISEILVTDVLINDLKIIKNF